MKLFTPRLALLLCLLALGAGRAATVQDTLVTLQVRNAPLKQVLLQLAQQTGVPMQIDDRLQEDPLTLEVTNQPMNKVLDYLARGYGLMWYEDRGTVIVTHDPSYFVELTELGSLPLAALQFNFSRLNKPVSLRFSEVPIARVFASLEAASGTKIVVDEGVPADIKASGRFDDAPLSRCLYMLLVPSGLYVRAENGTTLRVMSPMRVAVTRAGVDEPSVVERYPADYRGALGYLLAPRFWEQPDRYRVQVEWDELRQPRLRRQPQPATP